MTAEKSCASRQNGRGYGLPSSVEVSIELPLAVMQIGGV
jgi:hypothetical protein